MNKKLVFVATLAMILLPAALTMACPMCKDSIPHSEAERAGMVPSGFNLSVYLMLGGFLITLGLASGLIVKSVNNANKQIINDD
ncbi:MAG TPA: hypothetical protein VHD56_11390 [Tepidisphaeraceae bacterium]|nr:hypothetical protein [Tepidisphaeraceae bacterium]